MSDEVPSSGPPPPLLPAPVVLSESSTNGHVTSIEEGSKADIQSYVYNVGFLHAAWTDTVLELPSHGQQLRLHALFAARSPLLYRYLSNTNESNSGSGSSSNGTQQPQPPPYHIRISRLDHDKYVTPLALSMTLATLYGQQLPHGQILQSLDLAFGLVACGSILWLGEIAHEGVNAIISQLNPDSLVDILKFVFSHIDEESGDETIIDNITPDYQGPYPSYTTGVLKAVINFLLRDLIVPTTSSTSSSSSPAIINETVISLPFGLFKYLVEHETMGNTTVKSSPMERYSFVKQLVGEREKRRRARISGTSSHSSSSSLLLPTSPDSDQYEESVVLAFGGSSGSGVQIVRKPLRRRKTLWKAGN